jgi:hypothetical protein
VFETLLPAIRFHQPLTDLISDRKIRVGTGPQPLNKPVHRVDFTQNPASEVFLTDCINIIVFVIELTDFHRSEAKPQS